MQYSGIIYGKKYKFSFFLFEFFFLSNVEYAINLRFVIALKWQNERYFLQQPIISPVMFEPLTIISIYIHEFIANFIFQKLYLILPSYHHELTNYSHNHNYHQPLEIFTILMAAAV